MATINPMQVLAMQQALAGGQLAPQGALSTFLGQLGQPLGSSLGGLFGHPQQWSRFENEWDPTRHRLALLPFHVDPLTAAYGSGPLVPQGALGNIVGGLSGSALGGVMQPMIVNPRPNFGLILGTPIPVGSGKGFGTFGGWLGNRRPVVTDIIPKPLSFHVAPLMAAYGSGQLVPQGALGNIVGGLSGSALGGAIYPMLLPHFSPIGAPIFGGSGKGFGTLGGLWGNRPLSSLIMH